MKDEKLFELCRLLLPEDPTLETEVRNSLLHPKKAIAFIRSELGSRIEGIDIAASLPWYMMIASLSRRGLMFELSARTVAEGLDFYTNQLLRELSGTEYAATVNVDTSGTNDAVELIHSFLEITGEHLQAANYLLGEFRLESGISMISLIPQHSAERCQSLAKEAGHGEILLHPSNKNRKKLPRFLLLTEMVDEQRRKESCSILQSALNSSCTFTTYSNSSL
jgi:hypothetical protein